MIYLIYEKLYSILWLLLCLWTVFDLIKLESANDDSEKESTADAIQFIKKFFSGDDIVKMVSVVLMLYLMFDIVGFIMVHNYTHLEGFRHDILVFITTIFAIDSLIMVIGVKDLAAELCKNDPDVKKYDSLTNPMNYSFSTIYTYTVAFGKLLVAMQLFLWLNFIR